MIFAAFPEKSMATPTIAPARLQTPRERILRYVYEHGAGRPAWSVPADQVRRALQMTRDETVAASMLMYEQGLIAHNSPIRSIGLSDAGQREAERLNERRE